MKGFIHLAAMAIAVFAIALALPSFSVATATLGTPILLSQNVNFIPPDVTAPDNRIPGAHRGEACPKDLSITPLIPKTNIGLTLADSPTFLVYVSQPSTEVEFSLLADEGKGTEVYNTTFKVDKPGIVEVSIPKKDDRQKSLEVDQRYQWSFALACSPGDSSGNYFVQGLVQRIEAQETLKNDLANPDPMAKAIAYAKNGIWYDTIATLAQMRRKAPDDASLRVEWTQLLESQELQSIADQPLVQSF